MKVKICGITNVNDIEILNELKPNFAGFVMFYPAGKRNLRQDDAEFLLSRLYGGVASVAVTVSPTLKQVKTAALCGFDYIQVHGTADSEILDNPYLPVLRAFNVSNIDELDRCRGISNVAGYVFDAQKPGSGATFDWSLLENIPRDGKLFVLAGGLTPENAAEAAARVKPDVLDVSTGVENSSGTGKDYDKVKRFIEAVTG